MKQPTLKQQLGLLVRLSKSYGAYVAMKGSMHPEDRNQDWWYQKRIAKTKKEIRQMYSHLDIVPN